MQQVVLQPGPELRIGAAAEILDGLTTANPETPAQACEGGQIGRKRSGIMRLFDFKQRLEKSLRGPVQDQPGGPAVAEMEVRQGCRLPL